MVQAARSGKQNIAEGSQASGTSTESEIKLTNVARASLEELLIDYEDYIRTHRMQLWNKDSREAQFVRRLRDENAFRDFAETRSAEVLANIAICLIHQATYLLDRQIASLEERFVKNGGIRERMKNARTTQRSQRS